LLLLYWQREGEIIINKKKWSLSFYIAIPVILLIVILAIAIPDQFNNLTGTIKNFISSRFGWLYLLVASFLVLLCFYFMLSPKGKIRLGDPDSKPEHSTISWIAMLFSAGMGIGLIFYGAAEPLSLYAVSSPEATEYSSQALSDALKYSFFHYGVHAWSIYAIVGLALAYFQFRKKENTLISHTLKPLFGKSMDGIAGKIIDSLVIISTVAGVSTSLGFGASQINGGLNYLWKVPKAFWVQLIIIAVATVLFLFSALSGVNKGIKVLSNINIVIAVLLMFVAFFVGNGVYALENTSESFGEYISDFFRLSFYTAANGTAGQKEWIQNWTLLYWSWWFSWSPFVGVFIAKISKGRTIRQFVAYIILIPTIFSVLWFGIFGSLSISAVNADPTIASMPIEQMLFGVFNQYPLGKILSVIAIVLVFTFFITSADSATMVLGMQSENGTLNPSKKSKVIWGISVSTIAAVLLYAGGLKALQNILMIFALPFVIIVIFISISLIKETSFEAHAMGLSIRPKRHPVKGIPYRSYDLPVKERLQIFNDRKDFALIYSYKNKVIKTSGLSDELEISYNQALHVLKALMADEMISKSGSGNQVRYSLTQKGQNKAKELIALEDDQDIENTELDED